MASILLVEDDPDQLAFRKMILERAGHDVGAASSVEEALAKSPGREIVVMDLCLPAIEDGLHLVNALPGSTRVLVLSGVERWTPPLSMPNVSFLQKPYPTRKLLAMIAAF
jgi:DNA-binding NtrC family response regulator